MKKNKSVYIAKLKNAKVSRKGSLLPLLADNANAHIGRLNHRDVIATVTDGTRPLARPHLNHIDHLRLLRGTATAADDRWTLRRKVHKLGRVVLHAQFEVFASYDQRTVALPVKVVQLKVNVSSTAHRSKDVKLLHLLDQLRGLGNGDGRL